MNRLFTLFAFSLMLAACISTHEPYDDTDWDYVFEEEDPFDDYCMDPNADCIYYYPPYY